MLESHINCKIVVPRLEHLLHSVDEAIELRVWINIEEVTGRQLGGHIKDRLDIIHQEAVVKHREVSARREIAHDVGAT